MNKALEEQIRGILLQHTDAVYGYCKSKGKNNFDDMKFIKQILALISAREEQLLDKLRDIATEEVRKLSNNSKAESRAFGIPGVAWIDGLAKTNGRWLKAIQLIREGEDS